MNIDWKITPANQFSEFASSWDRLCTDSGNPPFLESHFLVPLLKQFGTGHETLALGTHNGHLIAAIILCKPSLGRLNTFQPSQLPLGPVLLANHISLQIVAPSLLKALPGFNLGLGFTQLDPRFVTRPDSSSTQESLDYVQTAWLDIDQNFDEYWNVRGKNLKQNMRKQRTKLEAEGISLNMECIRSADQVAEAIEQYGALESAGWKSQSGTAIHPDNAQGRFYRDMLERFTQIGRGRIYRYYFSDKIVAMDLCIESAGTMVILKTTYDESIRTLSPAFLMRQDQLRQIFDEQCIQRIEFYGKLMEWHTRWTDNARTLYHANIFRWALLKQTKNWLAHIRSERKAVADTSAESQG